MEEDDLSGIGSSQEELCVNNRKNRNSVESKEEAQKQTLNRYIRKQGSIGNSKPNIPKSIIPKKTSPVTSSEEKSARRRNGSARSLNTRSSSFCASGSSPWRSDPGSLSTGHYTSTSQVQLQLSQIRYQDQYQSQQLIGNYRPHQQHHQQHQGQHQMAISPFIYNRGANWHLPHEDANACTMGSPTLRGVNCNSAGTRHVFPSPNIHRLGLGPLAKDASKVVVSHKGGEETAGGQKAMTQVGERKGERNPKTNLHLATASSPVATSTPGNTMPTTTVVSTTSISTFTTSEGIGSTSTTSVIMSATSVSTQDDLNSYHNGDGKRKTPSERSDEVSPKRQNRSKDDEASRDVLNTLLKELTQIREDVRSGNTKMEKKMSEIQTENNNWKAKFCSLEKELVTVKESISNVNVTLKAEISDISTKQQMLGATVADIMTKYDKLENNPAEQSAPLENLKSHVEEMIGDIDFPVSKTIVAQNVVYSEGENLQDLASDLIHNAMELPEVFVVKTE